MGQIVRVDSHELNGGEVNSIPPHLIGLAEAQLAENVDPRSQLGPTTRPGRSQHGVDNGSGTSIKGLKEWTRDNGTQFVLARLATTFYDVSAAAWASIGIGGTSGAYFRAAPLLDTMVIVVDGLAPQKFTGSTLSALGGSPPAFAKYAALYASKVWLAGDTGNFQTVYFSSTNNPENWTATNDAGSITTQDGGGGTINGLLGTRRGLVIFYRNFVDVLIGDTVFNFRVERLREQGGLVSETGYASAGEIAFFAGDTGIFMVSGLNISDITTLKFREVYKAIADKTKISLAVKDDLLHVVDYGADKSYVCDYRHNRWAEWTGQAWEALDTGRSGTLFAGVDGGSTNQVWQIDTGSLDGASTLTAKWKTGDLVFGWPDAIKNLRRVTAHAKPGLPTTTLTVIKDGASMSSTQTLTFASTGGHSWDSVAGLADARSRTLALLFSWTGVGTLYGWTAYAEVTVDTNQIPTE